MGRSLFSCKYPGCRSYPSKKHNIQRHVWMKHLRKLPENFPHRKSDYIADIHRSIVNVFVISADSQSDLSSRDSNVADDDIYSSTSRASTTKQTKNNSININDTMCNGDDPMTRSAMYDPLDINDKDRNNHDDHVNEQKEAAFVDDYCNNVNSEEIGGYNDIDADYNCQYNEIDLDSDSFIETNHNNKEIDPSKFYLDSTVDNADAHSSDNINDKFDYDHSVNIMYKNDDDRDDNDPHYNRKTRNKPASGNESDENINYNINNNHNMNSGNLAYVNNYASRDQDKDNTSYHYDNKYRNFSAVPLPERCSEDNNNVNNDNNVKSNNSDRNNIGNNMLDNNNDNNFGNLPMRVKRSNSTTGIPYMSTKTTVANTPPETPNQIPLQHPQKRCGFIFSMDSDQEINIHEEERQNHYAPLKSDNDNISAISFSKRNSHDFNLTETNSNQESHQRPRTFSNSTTSTSIVTPAVKLIKCHPKPVWRPWSSSSHE